MKTERAREIYKKLKGLEGSKFWKILLEETTSEDRKDICVFLDNDFAEFSFISETPDADDDTARCLLEPGRYQFYYPYNVDLRGAGDLLDVLGFTVEYA